MAKKVTSLVSKVDPFTAKVTDPILGKAGLPNITGNDGGKAAAAEDAADKAAAQNKSLNDALVASQRNAMDQAANAARDLSQENVAKVIAGGTAGTIDQSDDQRRKKFANGISSGLGINAS